MVFAIGLCCLSFVVQSQSVVKNEAEKINETILELFDAYRAGDSARVAKVFTKKANLQTLQRNEDGKVVLSETMPVTKLVNYVGGGLAEVHDERLWDTQLFYDDVMATVWTKYAFYLGKKFLHCGTETFLLRKLNGEWKIFYLVDTRQTENCIIPSNIK